MPIPEDRWYSQDHHWVQTGTSPWTVGLTDFAQDALGQVTVVQFVAPGTSIGAGAEMGEIEAFKAMTDLYMPVAARLVETNPALAANPMLVNDDPYGDGWLCRIEPDHAEPDDLLDAAGYRALIGPG